MQLVQNKACHISLKAQKRDHIEDMQNDSNLLLLAKRRELRLALQYHKNVYPEGQQSLSKFFNKMTSALEARTMRLHDGPSMKVPQVPSTQRSLVSLLGGRDTGMHCAKKFETLVM